MKIDFIYPSLGKSAISLLCKIFSLEIKWLGQILPVQLRLYFLSIRLNLVYTTQSQIISTYLRPRALSVFFWMRKVCRNCKTKVTKQEQFILKYLTTYSIHLNTENCRTLFNVRKKTEITNIYKAITQRLVLKYYVCFLCFRQNMNLLSTASCLILLTLGLVQSWSLEGEEMLILAMKIDGNVWKRWPNEVESLRTRSQLL